MADNPGFVETHDLEKVPQVDYEPNLSKKVKNDLTITWTKLCVEVKNGTSMRKTLSSFSGHFKSKEMVGILGPSGSGKTTFLKCLSLKQRPVSGKVDYHSSTGQCDFSYVPQTDDLYMYLTVEESLLFASQFKNRFRSYGQHFAKVNQVIEQFGLRKCANNLVKRCSGGEIRRLSIALEVVADPDVLVLDEPTTGLDSFTARSCMLSIKKAVNNGGGQQMAVLMTIHQPNTELFFMFDRVYILSGGRCIYGGPPKWIPENFQTYHLNCPPTTNPADFAMDIACKGPEDPVVMMLHENYLREVVKNDMSPDPLAFRIKPKNAKRERSFLAGFLVNAKRLMLSNLRDPQQSVIRLFGILFLPILIMLLSKPDSLNASYCAYQSINETHVDPENSYVMFDRRKLAVQSVMYLLFNALYSMLSSAFPATLVFTGYIRALVKEYQNNWYTFNSFFFAFVLVQIFYAVFYTLANSILMYILGPGWFTMETFIFFCCVNAFLAIIGDVYGFLAGTIFARNQIVATMFITTSLFAVLLMSDFIIQAKFLLPDFQFMYNLSTFHYGIIIMLKLVFPMEPCILEGHKIFGIRKIQDFIRFFNFETGSHLDDLEDVHEKEWEIWEETTFTKDNMTSFIVDRSCGLNGTVCHEQLGNQLNHFWNTKMNLMANEYLLLDVDVIQNLSLGVGLIVLHYAVCYFVALLRAKAH